MEKSETFISSTDEDDSCCQQLTGTEPYPGPSLIESASVLVKNWVRQGYNDFLAVCNDDGKAGPAVESETETVLPVSAEYDAVPPTEEVCTVLGHEYCAIRDREDLLKDLESRLWFTYRRGFPPIGGTGPQSDTGWGCMLRCGQMMLAQALVNRHLGRDWRWTKNAATRGGSYEAILKLFQDRKDALYSIHQIAQMGQSEGKPVGSWFGPNTAAQVIRRLSLYDDWSSLCVYVAMDNTVVVQDIETLCTQPIPHPATTEVDDSSSAEDSIDSPPPSLSSVIVGKDLISSLHLRSFFPPSSSFDRTWHPLLLIIPLRLGLTEINPMYVEPLKACLSMKQSVGIIGGTPNHAHYFVGHLGDSLFFLDPHTTQNSVDLEEVAAFYDAEENTRVLEGEEPENDHPDRNVVEDREDAKKTCEKNEGIGAAEKSTSTSSPSPPDVSKTSILRGDESYHSALPERMKILDLDPSVAVGFFCRDEADFNDLCEAFESRIVRHSGNMFELSRTHPPHWPPFDPYPNASPTSVKGAAASIAEFMLVESERHYDTDEEFELL